MFALLPLLAEVADKLPAATQMWPQAVAIGGVMAVLVGGLSAVRQRWGGFAAVAVMVCSAWIVSDLSLDPDILRELGSEYLVQRRCAPLVPAAFAALGWLCLRRWHRFAGNSPRKLPNP